MIYKFYKQPEKPGEETEPGNDVPKLPIGCAPLTEWPPKCPPEWTPECGKLDSKPTKRI